ncbi:MAG: hypothetical protein NG784_04380 [Candidatus Jettenia sp.]|nr:hypothetical protein [Candidatus Jettenia sp.]
MVLPVIPERLYWESSIGKKTAKETGFPLSTPHFHEGKFCEDKPLFSRGQAVWEWQKHMGMAGKANGDDTMHG